jgi:hypothetical protein
MSSGNKIAFLFLVLDDPHFPQIWDYYFKGYEHLINIYIHPKYPERHTWKPEKIVSNLQETGWGFITRAYISLLTPAYENKENAYFITISESCVPVKPFRHLYMHLFPTPMSVPKSMIKFMKVSKYDYEARLMSHYNQMRERNNQIKEQNAKKIILPNLGKPIKHYARFGINRPHTKLIMEVQQQNKLEFYHTMHVGDEFWLNSIYPKLSMHSLETSEITFDDWDYVKIKVNDINKEIENYYVMQENGDSDETIKEKIDVLKAKKNDIAKNPKSITILDETDITQMQTTSAYFYRKFTKQSNVQEYMKMD